MDKATLEKFRVKDFPMNIQSFSEEDEFGFYSTGIFRFGDKVIIISHESEDGGWHLSVSTKNRLPSYEEMKDIRYKFLPNRINAVEIFPPREKFVNIHKFCRHLWEMPEDGIDRSQKV